jgi:hypothetical protein
VRDPCPRRSNIFIRVIEPQSTPSCCRPITLTIGIAIGFWIGPDQEYFFLGVTMTMVLVFLYWVGNIGVFFLYRRERPAEFSSLLHFFFSLFSTASLLWVAYKSVVPLPDRPLRYAPLPVGVWLLAGIVVLLTVRPASNMPPLPVDSPDS